MFYAGVDLLKDLQKCDCCQRIIVLNEVKDGFCYECYDEKLKQIFKEELI
jgi:hypothetical protein